MLTLLKIFVYEKRAVENAFFSSFVFRLPIFQIENDFYEKFGEKLSLFCLFFLKIKKNCDKIIYSDMF